MLNHNDVPIQAKLFLIEVLNNCPVGINSLATLGIHGNVEYRFQKDADGAVEALGDTDLGMFTSLFTDSLEMREFLSVSLRSFVDRSVVEVRGWGFYGGTYFPLTMDDLSTASVERIRIATQTPNVRYMDSW